jgi:hypothetical protein
MSPSIKLKTIATILIGVSQTVTWANTSVVSTTTEHNFSYLASKVASGIHQQYPNLFYKSCEAGANAKYRCGEVPYGDILNEKKKLALEVKIPSQKFSSGGFNGVFPASQFNVYLSRNQKNGASISEKIIGNDEDSATTSSYFGKDFFLKLSSNNNQLFARACVYAPGVSVESDKQRITFSATRVINLWLTSLKTTIDVTTDIYVSPYSFQAMKSCGDIAVKPVVKNGRIEYATEVLGIKYPETIGLDEGKVSINVSVKGGNFLGSIVNFFAEDKIKSSIKKALENKLGDKVDKLDIESGKWVEELTKDSYDKLFTNNLSKKLAEAMSKDFSPNINELTTKIVSSCQSLVNEIKNPALDKIHKDELLKDCLDFKSLSVNGFIADKASAQAGCYRDFIRLTQLDPITRPVVQELRNCKFTHQISVNVKDRFKPIATCLLDRIIEKNATNACEKEALALVDPTTRY